MMDTPHVQIRGVTKRFGATVALADINLTIARGTLHALVGENGAGKSTLGRLIAGVHGADKGEMSLSGRVVNYRSPRQALDDGLTIVAQELSLVGSRTVLENVFLGKEDHWGPFVRTKSLVSKYELLVRRTGIHVEPSAKVAGLGVAERQKVEILRALARDAELIVMDEPTARLSSDQAKQLMTTIRRLADAGTTFVLVSHFLDEVLEVADMVTVLRDGRVVRTGPIQGETHTTLVEAMIGRPFEANFPPKSEKSGSRKDVLNVRGLGREGVFKDVSFSVGAGEVVVLAGLVGAGRSEVARTIYGADRADAGTVEIQGCRLNARHPASAIAAGISMIPESRKDQGLILRRPILENISLPYLRSLSRFGVVRGRKEERLGRDVAERAGVAGAELEAEVANLSGGNQQKVLFARSMLRVPKLLIADEPTRGVDVGAKRAIYDLMAGLAEDGMGILVISSELEEVIGLAHRVLVMRAGRLVAELAGEDVTESNILRAAFGTLTQGEL